MEIGLQALVLSDFSTAKALFSERIENNSATPECFLFRGIAFLGHADYEKSLDDLKEALTMSAEGDNKLKFECLFHLGVSMFFLQRFSEAIAYFESASALAVENFQKVKIAPWISKTRRELDRPPLHKISEAGFMPKKNIDVEGEGEGKSKSEVPMSDIGIPEEEKSAAQIDTAQIDPKIDPDTKIETQSPLPQKVPVPAPAPVPGPPQDLSKEKILYDWYQNQEYVFADLKVKGLKKEGVKVEFGVNEVQISIHIDENSDLQFTYDLADTIKPESSSYSVTSRKIDLKLCKTGSIQWPAFERKVGNFERSVYPSSIAGGQRKDWDKIDVDTKHELEKDKPEGEEGMNTLFKEIFK